MLPKSVESVFIFQEGSEGEPNVATATYDAIVVEQWTVIDVSGEIFLFLYRVCALCLKGCIIQYIHAGFNGTLTSHYLCGTQRHI